MKTPEFMRAENEFIECREEFMKLAVLEAEYQDHVYSDIEYQDVKRRTCVVCGFVDNNLTNDIDGKWNGYVSTTPICKNKDCHEVRLALGYSGEIDYMVAYYSGIPHENKRIVRECMNTVFSQYSETNKALSAVPEGFRLEALKQVYALYLIRLCKQEIKKCQN